MTNWTVDSNATTTVETMLMSLAGVCDGAADGAAERTTVGVADSADELVGDIDGFEV